MIQNGKICQRTILRAPIAADQQIKSTAWDNSGSGRLFPSGRGRRPPSSCPSPQGATGFKRVGKRRKINGLQKWLSRTGLRVYAPISLKMLCFSVVEKPMFALGVTCLNAVAPRGEGTLKLPATSILGSPRPNGERDRVRGLRDAIGRIGNKALRKGLLPFLNFAPMLRPLVRHEQPLDLTALAWDHYA